MKKFVDFNKIMSKAPRCPLCLRPMELAYDPFRKIQIFRCAPDNIAVNVMDPVVGKWERHEKIPCPSCGTDMRVFFTSVGFMLAKCPKKGCGCTVRTSNVEGRTAPGTAALKTDGMTEDLKKEIGHA